MKETASTAPANLLDITKTSQDHELFQNILQTSHTRIERIVSFGHTTPIDLPYQQNWDEWVLILSGSAIISLEGIGQIPLAVGQHLFIPAGTVHRVLYTENPTIWLAIHCGEQHVSASISA